MSSTGQERMDSMKSWAREGRKECLLCDAVSAFRVLIVLRSHLMSWEEYSSGLLSNQRLCA